MATSDRSAKEPNPPGSGRKGGGTDVPQLPAHSAHDWISAWFAEEARKAFPAMKRAETSIRAFLASPRTQRLIEGRKRAINGDQEALIEILSESGIEVLGDHNLRNQIHRLDPDDPTQREALERIVETLRRTLLTPRRRGRRPGVPVEAITLVTSIQAAYDGRPVRLKRSYRNPAARQLDIREISEHVARSVPPEWRGQVRRAAQDVLKRAPGTRKGFGVEVVAKSCSRSSRWIRSTRKPR